MFFPSAHLNADAKRVRIRFLSINVEADLCDRLHHGTDPLAKLIFESNQEEKPLNNSSIDVFPFHSFLFVFCASKPVSEPTSERKCVYELIRSPIKVK